MATHLADIRWRLAIETLRALPQPSWPTLIGVLGAAVLGMWWITMRQTPTIDPDSVIAANLAAAQHAMRQQRYVEPLDRSALHHFTTVLALDPANVEAHAGLERISGRFVEQTKTAIVDGRIADAVVALDTLRRVDPDHRRIALLDAQLRRALEERAILHASTARPSGKQGDEKLIAPQAASKATVMKPTAELASAAPTPMQSREQPETPVALAATSEPAQALQAAAPGIEPVATPVEAISLVESAPTEQPVAAPPAPAVAEVGEPSPAPAQDRVLLSYVAPEYPRDAMMRGIEGWIDIEMSVTPAGDVVNPTVHAGKARQLFERNALAAVKRWKYAARPDATAPEHMKVRVSFKLQN